jgi:hypothetical protein
MKKVILYIIVLTVASCTQSKTEQSVDHSRHMHGSAGNYADSVNAGLIKDTLKGSPVRTAMANFGSNHVHIQYGSPGVKGRTIWGGLVAYDQVWVTGAHQATSVMFSSDVVINETHIAAGKYALFTIPGKDKWIVILNKNWEQHLADEYSEKDDVVRIKITPETLPQEVQRLTYLVEKIDADVDKGSIVMLWERIKIVLPFRNQ